MQILTNNSKLLIARIKTEHEDDTFAIIPELETENNKSYEQVLKDTYDLEPIHRVEGKLQKCLLLIYDTIEESAFLGFNTNVLFTALEYNTLYIDLLGSGYIELTNNAFFDSEPDFKLGALRIFSENM